MDAIVKGSHVGLGLFGVGEDIGALLGVHTRDTKEKVALETQSNGRTRLKDCLAGLLDVDLEDGLFRYLFGGRAEANG